MHRRSRRQFSHSSQPFTSSLNRRYHGLSYHRSLRCEMLEDRRMLSTFMVDMDAPPGGDGLAWVSAYDDLQRALEQASVFNIDGDPNNDIDQIWIAEGVYKPSALLETGNTRSASFSLVDGVTLYGGFSGTEAAVDERDWIVHVTRFSGDIGTLDDDSDNAYTVVYCGAGIEAAVDGVLVADGNADGSSVSGHPERRYGGGIYNYGTLTVTNSTIAGNSARYGGGGIDNSTGTLTVTNSTIADNSANYEGGGIDNFFGRVTVTNSTIAGNSASAGGGIYNSGTLTVTNSTITDNLADYRGGGIYLDGSSSVSTLNNTIVAGNGAIYGSDIYPESGALSGSYNLIGNGSGQSALVDGVNGNQVGTSSSPIDPLLSNWTPMDNGQWGYLLLPGSPALDTGHNALALDPMGQPLVGDMWGNPRIQNGTVDIGAMEGATVGSPAQVYTVTSLSETIATDGVLTFLEAFEASSRNQPVGDALAGSFSEQDIIRFAEGLSGTVLVEDDELVIIGDLRIEGPGAELMTFQANGQNRVFLVWTNVSVHLHGMTITGGLADRGGGIYNTGTLTVTNSTIAGNSATIGGGIFNYGTLTVTNSTVAGNSADYGDGGGIYNTGTLTVTNSTIAGNSADYGDGGGIYNTGTLTVTNSTIAGNSADYYYYGGGIYLSGSSSVSTLNNTIVAGNGAISGSDIYCESGSLSGFYNLIGDGSGQSALVDGVNGNQVGTSSSPIDPLLSHWTQMDNGQWGYFLLPESPALDTGHNDLALAPMGQPLVGDMWGNPRIQNGTVDMGAVEGATVGSPAQVYTVTSLSETIATDGVLTFLEAFEASIRNQPVGDALAGSFSEQDIIRFAEGLSGTVLVENDELVIIGDLRIEGPGAELMTFQANGQNRVFLVRPNVSVHLHGMTITGGLAERGGGIYNTGTLTVTNSTIAGNSADYSGGGIYNIGTLTVTNSTIAGNSADYDSGGGIYNSGMLTVTNSTIAGNSASYDGGGIYNSTGTLTVTNSTVTGNSAGYGGGGIYNSGTLTVTNSTVADNLTSFGGGISNSGTLTVTNSTIAGNSANHEGGEIYNTGTLTVTNSTIAGISANNGGGIYNTGTLTVTNSTIAGNSANHDGGGIYNTGTLTVTNSTIAGNSARYGGGIWNYGGTLTVTNSTIADNLANDRGGGIFLYGSSSVSTLNNTIVAGNGAISGSDIYHESGALSGSYNLIGNGSGQSELFDGVDGNQVGTSSSPINPLLCDTSRLLSGSPAINAGNNALAVDAQDNPLTTDLDGKERIIYGTVDIGAYEFGLVADTDIDGDVDSQDLKAWQSGFGIQTGATFSDGDADNDDDVDGNDFLAWQQNFGSTMASGLAASSSGDTSIPPRAPDSGSGAFLSKNGEPTGLPKNTKAAALSPALARSNNQFTSSLPVDHQNTSFDSVDFAGWSLPQPMPKTNGSTISWLYLPEFKSRSTNQAFQHNRATDAVMSGLDERMRQNDLQRVHGKVADIPFTDFMSVSNEITRISRVGKISLQQITGRSMVIDDRVDMEMALEELVGK